MNNITPVSDHMPGLAQDIMVAGFGIAIAALLLAALVLALRRDDARLLILLLSGGAASLLESFACSLIRCHHAVEGSYVVYEAFDVHTPLWLAEVYVIFFGGAGYGLLRMFENHPSPQKFALFLALTGVGEGLFEMYCIHLGMFGYYGRQPFTILGFPWHLGFVNPALAAAFTLAAAFWFRKVQGLRRFYLPLIIPPLMIGVYASMVTLEAAGLYADHAALTQAGGVAAAALALLIAVFSYRQLRELSHAST